MKNVFGSITLLALAIFSLSSCATSSYTGRDYTKNYSRVKKSSDRRVATQRTRSAATTSRSVRGKRAQLLSSAKKYIGTPYRYGGKDPAGFDCSGFTQYVYRSQGLSLPSNSASQAQYGKRLPALQAKPGDLLIFREKGRVQHVGMIVDNSQRSLKMIHASSSRGVIIEDVMDSSYWKKRMAYAVSVIGS